MLLDAADLISDEPIPGDEPNYIEPLKESLLEEILSYTESEINKAVLRNYSASGSYAETASACNLSRERIRQILREIADKAGNQLGKISADTPLKQMRRAMTQSYTRRTHVPHADQLHPDFIAILTKTTFDSLTDRFLTEKARTLQTDWSTHKTPVQGAATQVKTVESIFSVNPRDLKALLANKSLLYQGARTKTTWLIRNTRITAVRSIVDEVLNAAVAPVSHLALIKKIRQIHKARFVQPNVRALHETLKHIAATDASIAYTAGYWRKLGPQGEIPQPVAEWVKILKKGPMRYHQLCKAAQQSKTTFYSALKATRCIYIHPATGVRIVGDQRPAPPMNKIQTAAFQRHMKGLSPWIKREVELRTKKIVLKTNQTIEASLGTETLHDGTYAIEPLKETACLKQYYNCTAGLARIKQLGRWLGLREIQLTVDEPNKVILIKNLPPNWEENPTVVIWRTKATKLPTSFRDQKKKAESMLATSKNTAIREAVLEIYKAGGSTKSPLATQIMAEHGISIQQLAGYLAGIVRQRGVRKLQDTVGNTLTKPKGTGAEKAAAGDPGTLAYEVWRKVKDTKKPTKHPLSLTLMRQVKISPTTLAAFYANYKRGRIPQPEPINDAHRLARALGETRGISRDITDAAFHCADNDLTEWSKRWNKAYVRAQECARDLERLKHINEQERKSLSYIGLAGEGWLDAFTFEDCRIHYQKYISVEWDSGRATVARRFAELLEKKHGCKTELLSGSFAEAVRYVENAAWDRLKRARIGRIDYDSMTSICNAHTETIKLMYSAAPHLAREGVFKMGVAMHTTITELRCRSQQGSLTRTRVEKDPIVAKILEKKVKQATGLSRIARTYYENLLFQIFATLRTANDSAIDSGGAAIPRAVTLYMDGQQMLHYAIDVIPLQEGKRAAKTMSLFYEALRKLEIEDVGFKDSPVYLKRPAAVTSALADPSSKTAQKDAKPGRKPRVICTPAHTQQIERLLQQKKTVAQIVPEVGLSASVVNKIKRSLGYVKPRD